MIFFVAEHNSLSIFIIYIKIMEEQHNLCEHVQTKWFVLYPYPFSTIPQISSIIDFLGQFYIKGRRSEIPA